MLGEKGFRYQDAGGYAGFVLRRPGQIITGFDSFQVGSSSAIQQLEQLHTDSQKQLSALKSQGKDVFNLKVSPAV